MSSTRRRKRRHIPPMKRLYRLAVIAALLLVCLTPGAVVLSGAWEGATALAQRFALCRELGLNLVGLMCIPPVDEEPSLHFALLAKIAARNGLNGLSMGMSGDFERAIALGATHVRVGSAIFGERVAG